MIPLNEILIRRISKDDLPKVIDLLQDISVYNPPKKKYDSIWESYSNQQHVFGYCFFYKQQLIGYGSINLEMKLKKGLMAYLEDVVVHRAYRNKKIGKLIVDYLVETAQKKDCYKIKLDCNKNNLLFYEKLGFQENGFSMVKSL
jgi:ribosomal protein S18 acetylase RimI-like enzyme